MSDHTKEPHDPEVKDISEVEHEGRKDSDHAKEANKGIGSYSKDEADDSQE